MPSAIRRCTTIRTAGKAGTGAPRITGAIRCASASRETYGTVEDLLQNCEMVVFWAADPETTSGSYGAQEGTVRRQWLKKLGVKIVHIDPALQLVGPVPAGQMDLPEADHVAGARFGDRLCLDQGRALRQGLRRHAHRRLRRLEGLCHGRERRHAQVARMAGEGDRRSGQRRARAGARMGGEAHLSRLRRLGQRPRRRLPQPDRHPMGAHDGVPDRDAGPGQARHQHGQSAMGRPGRSQFLLPGLRRRRHVGRHREDGDGGRALSAHAAAADDEHAAAKDSAPLSCPRRSSRAKPTAAIRGTASRSSRSSPSSAIRRPVMRRCG